MEKCLKIIYRSGTECSVWYDDETHGDLYGAIYRKSLGVFEDASLDSDNDIFKKRNISIYAEQIDHLEILL